MDPKALPARLAEARKDRGLSQAALAERAGVHVMMVSAWERGLNRPRIDHLAAVARELGVTVDWLVAGRPTHSKEKRR